MSAVTTLARLLVVVTLLTACNAATATISPDIADRSFITDQPCKAPCWYGLELNFSSESDVRGKLSELPFVDKQTIRVSKASILKYNDATEIDYDCAEPKGHPCGYLILAQDQLKLINFSLMFQLTLKSAVDKLGVPTMVEYHSYTPHGQGCLFDLKWPTKNIFVRSIDETGDKSCRLLSAGKALDPTTTITEISYIAPDAMPFQPSQCGVCIKWPGFQGP